MKDLFKFEEENKIWNIFFKNIPVWSYLRGAFYGQFLPYSPKIKFSIEDVKGLLVFISLLWNKNKVIVFVSARKDLMDYSFDIASEKFGNSEAVIFLRSEGGVSGNVFLIEVIRFLFRKFFWIFFVFSFFKFSRILKNIDKNINLNLVKDMMGDYGFNFFLSLFLRKSKVVLYSNSVVPRVERYMNLYNSIEIQHGVVHKEHLDYVRVPYVNNKFLCYSNLVKEELERWGFTGEVDVFEKTKSFCDIKYQVVIFGTVDPDYSKLIEEIFYRRNNDAKVKLHPRDSYKYADKILKSCISVVSPLEVEVPILPDTSLISDCFLNNKFFIYLALNSHSKEYNYDYLINKYNIYDEASKNFEICFNVDEVLSLLEKIYGD